MVAKPRRGPGWGLQRPPPRGCRDSALARPNFPPNPPAGCIDFIFCFHGNCLLPFPLPAAGPAPSPSGSTQPRQHPPSTGDTGDTSTVPSSRDNPGWQCHQLSICRQGPTLHPGARCRTGGRFWGSSRQGWPGTGTRRGGHQPRSAPLCHLQSLAAGPAGRHAGSLARAVIAPPRQHCPCGDTKQRLPLAEPSSLTTRPAPAPAHGQSAASPAPPAPPARRPPAPQQPGQEPGAPTPPGGSAGLCLESGAVTR